MAKKSSKRVKKNSLLKVAEDEFEKVVAMKFEGDDDPIQSAMDVVTHGCQSGSCPDLVYYKDTIEFFNKHKEDINEQLKEDLDSTGFTSPAELFGKKWDTEDPLAMDTQNQNLLAWYGFEEKTRRLLQKLGKDV